MPIIRINHPKYRVHHATSKDAKQLAKYRKKIQQAEKDKKQNIHKLAKLENKYVKRARKKSKK